MNLKDVVMVSACRTAIGKFLGGLKNVSARELALTVENIAAKYGISRKESDELAIVSQSRSINAIDNGFFKEEIMPVEIKSKKGSNSKLQTVKIRF